MAEHIPLTALRAFEAAARHLSLRRAAEELFVTPAAISQQIRTLEDLLDVRLFHRLPRGLALTEAGKAGLPKAREGLAALGESVRLMRAGEGRRALNAWMAPSFASKWLMPRLDGFVRAQPDVDLRVVASGALIDSSAASHTGVTAEHLRRENIDVAIRFGNGDYPGCRVERLMAVDLVPLCSPRLLEASTHPLARPCDLRHHTLLHDDTPYEGRRDWSAWLRANGVEGVDGTRGLRFNRLSLALDAAIEAQGVALGIRQLAARDIVEGRLIMPLERAFAIDSAYHVITLPETHEDANVVAFREWLHAEVDTGSLAAA